MAEFRQKYLKALFLISLLVIMVTFSLAELGVFKRLDWLLVDLHMRAARAETTLPDQVAVVLIDEASLQTLNPILGRYPWPRSVYSDLIDYFSIGGARAIMFDILFTENERSAGAEDGLSADDRQLIMATAEYGNVYHAAQLMQEMADEDGYVHEAQPLPSVFRERFAISIAGAQRSQNNNYFLPLDGLYQAAAGVGIVRVDPDPDGVYRKVRLFDNYAEDFFPAFSLSALMNLYEVSTMEVVSGELAIGDLKVPLFNNDFYLLNLYSNYRPYSVSAVLQSYQKIQFGELDNLVVSPDEFADKIVFIGASAIGLEDVKLTALSSITPGVYLHATVVGNGLERDFLRIAHNVWSYLLVAVLTALVMAAIFRVKNLFLQSLIPVILGSLVWGTLAWLHFNGTVVFLVAPLFAIVLSWLLGVSYMSFSEGRDKRVVRKMFSQYVSSAVLDELESNPDFLSKVSRKEELSILFSDIRGFTTISESLEAEQVVEMLNYYFSVMSEIIFEYSGTMDKFIGDAIMAFWGAPVRVSDHATKAVLAGLAMARSLPEVNKILKERGLPEIRVGIGINTANVVLGNIGSERKLDYTVIGDGVNLASRMEGLTKNYGCEVLISESTYRAMDSDIPCILVDQVRVKGKNEGVRIFSPVAFPDDSSELIAQAREEVRISQDAFEHYLDRRWDLALSIYQRLTNHTMRDMYIARCHEYRENPPDEAWDGIYTMKTK